MAFGTGKGFRYLAVYEMPAGLGRQKELTLSMFHALIGCDTVSSFTEYGRMTAWPVFPELTAALFKVSSGPTTVQKCVMHNIERCHRFIQPNKHQL